MAAVGTLIFRRYVNYSYKFILISKYTRYWLSAYVFNQVWTGSLFGIGAVDYNDEFKISGINVSYDVAAVPIPAAAFLFGPALLGFMGLRRKAKQPN